LTADIVIAHRIDH